MESLELLEVMKIKDEEDRDLALLNLVRNTTNQDNWKNAEIIANKILGQYEKSEAYLSIYQGLKHSNDDEALRVLKKSEDEAVSADEEWQKSELLLKIGKEYFDIEQVDKAQKVWLKAVTIAKDGEKKGSTQDSLDCSSVLGEIALHLRYIGLTDEALQIASGINNRAIRERTLQQI